MQKHLEFEEQFPSESDGQPQVRLFSRNEKALWGPALAGNSFRTSVVPQVTS